MIYRQKARRQSAHNVTSRGKINMRDRIRGFIFISLWYLSIIAGFFFLVCPILPLIVISPKRYRRWSDVIFGMWEPFPVAMMEIFFGIKVILTGDKINPFEGSLLIMNHRTRVDWNFLWMGLFHCCQPNAHNMKYVLKAPIMHIPGPGWVMQTCSFIFIHRNWEKDRQLLDKMLDYLNETDDVYQILLFPEGTDLTENNLQKSHRYADEHNLERYYKVLHPKTTGFAFLAKKMNSGGQLKAIYDVTIGYPKTTPQNEKDLFSGKFPEEVHFHVKRYGSSNFSSFREEDLKLWLTTIWQEKEKMLQNFHTTGSFAPNETKDKMDYGRISNEIIKCNSEGFDHNLNSDGWRRSTAESKIFTQNHMNSDNVYTSKNYRPSRILHLVLAFWLSFIVIAMYMLFNCFYLQLWVFVHSLLFTVLSLTGNGFHQIAASMYFYTQKKKPCIMKKIE